MKIEITKKNQMEIVKLKSTITQIKKRSLEKLNNRLEEIEESFSELKNRSIEIMHD